MMEHFANGVSVCRKAIDVPDWIIEELLDMRQAMWDLHWDIKGDVATHVDSGVEYTLENQKKWPTIVHPHYPNPPRSDDFRDWWITTEHQIYEVVLKYLEKYPLLMHSLWWRDKGHALIYEPGARLTLHQDNNVGYTWAGREGVVGRSEVSTRNVLTTTLHVDDCEGGEMHFPYAGVTIPAEQGDVLCFPANYLGAHEVTPVKEGSRRISYLGWFGQGSTLPLATPKGEHDVEILEIFDPAEVPDANFHWQTSIEEDFLRSSGWTEQKMREEYETFYSQEAALYWPKGNE
jgi:hypothetical protein